MIDDVAAVEPAAAESRLLREDERVERGVLERVLLDLEPDESQRVGRVVGVAESQLAPSASSPSYRAWRECHSRRGSASIAGPGIPDADRIPCREASGVARRPTCRRHRSYRRKGAPLARRVGSSSHSPGRARSALCACRPRRECSEQTGDNHEVGRAPQRGENGRHEIGERKGHRDAARMYNVGNPHPPTHCLSRNAIPAPQRAISDW